MKKEDAAKRVIPIAANPLFDPGKCLEIRANHLAKIAGSNRAPSGDTDGVAYKSYRSIKQPDSHATGVVAARGGHDAAGWKHAGTAIGKARMPIA